MAVIANYSSPNFATGNYHRIIRVDMICSPNEPNPRYEVYVGHYFSEEARRINTSPMCVNVVVIPLNSPALGQDPRDRLYEIVMADAMFAASNPVSDASEPVVSGA